MSENNSCEGFEVISRVTDIPRGSGLAVSTNLLAALILALMRFSGQMQSRDGEISDADKLQVVARCIYGEWLGGSGGGWQDCAGLWGGFKLISGQPSDAAFELTVQVHSYLRTRNFKLKTLWRKRFFHRWCGEWRNRPDWDLY
jgi:galactokinase/mevalonate kinase-like predicted kinase